MLLEATQLPQEKHCSCQANQQMHSPLQVLGQLCSSRGLNTSSRACCGDSSSARRSTAAACGSSERSRISNLLGQPSVTAWSGRGRTSSATGGSGAERYYDINVDFVSLTYALRRITASPGGPRPGSECRGSEESLLTWGVQSARGPPSGVPNAGSGRSSGKLSSLVPYAWLQNTPLRCDSCPQPLL